MMTAFTPDLDAVRRAFTANFTASDELGAAVSVWQDGVEILSLAGGHRARAGNTATQNHNFCRTGSRNSAK
jgi:CubicO group peptidase (beta-lactamase class C family)